MRILILSVFALLLMAPANAQTEVGDVTLPNTMQAGGETLMLNGAGIREKLWFDLYSGGLYLTEKSKDAEAIMTADKAMAMKLHITSKLITSEKMIDAVNEGFEKATGGNTAAISKEIETFKGFFADEIVKDNIFDIIYVPGTGVVVSKNGTKQGTVKGMAFKKALFGIWLGNDPADKNLKTKMLGK